ncbi:MAG: OsmC family protein [Bauldia sp.]
MDRDTLRAVQRPLKDLYRSDAAAALITLRAAGKVSEGISCSVETGRELVKAGLHPSTGGPLGAVCSGDMLLQALVACAGVTLAAVATALGLKLRDAEIRAEGDLDVRGTLGVDREAPVGFGAIRLAFALDGEMTEADRDRLIATTERYCVVLQTLRHSPALAVSVRTI